MKIEKFDSLNLQVGQKVRISFKTYFENIKKNQTWTIKTIESKILAPNKIEKCLVNINGAFLRVSDIDEIKILN